MNRNEWLQHRKTGLGASDAAAVLGVSPWKGALETFHEKRGTLPPSEAESFARRLGLALEPGIAELYAQETGRRVITPAPGHFRVRQHPKKPYLFATLDGDVTRQFSDREQDGVLEIKTAAITKSAFWTDEPPIDYQVQVQHQLAVTGAPFATIVALIGGVQLKYKDIEPDKEFIELLTAAEDEFWRRVEQNDPPPPDGTEATKEFLKRLYPDAKPSRVALPPESLDWDAKRREAIVEMKGWTEQRTLAENMLKAAIGENVEGVLPNGVVFTLKRIDKKTYTVPGFSYRELRRKEAPGAKVTRGAPKLSIETAAEQFQDDERAAEDFEL